MSVSPLYYACFLNNYNNYFNRIIKGFETLAEYQTAVGEGNYFLFSKAINYSPKDNVSTELIMNDCPFEPDYLLILDSELSIVARWFVIRSTFTREKQRKYELRRDVIFDYKESLINAPMFVQKGHLPDSDSFIVNDEGMSLNQIKSDETLLKDRTNSAWVVGYIAKDAGSGNPSVQVQDEVFEYTSFSDLATAAGMNESDLSSVLNLDGTNTNPAYFTKKVRFYFANRYWFFNPNTLIRKYRECIDMNPDLASLNSSWNYADPFWQDILWDVPASVASVVNPENMCGKFFYQAVIANKAAMLAQLPTIFNRKYFTKYQYDKLYAYKDKIIKYNGLYYLLKFNQGTANQYSQTSALAYTSYSALRTVVEAASTAMGVSPKANGDIFIGSQYDEVYIQLEYISDESDVIPSIQTKVSASRNTVENQAFDMFCIPYGPALFKSDAGNQEATANAALSIGAQIALKLDAKLYDIQLLPYCPLIEKFDSNNRIDLTALDEDEDFNYIDKTQSRVRTTETFQGVVEEDPDNPGYYECNIALTIPDTNTADILDMGYSVQGPDASYVQAISLNKVQVGTSVIIRFNAGVSNQQADNFTVSIWYEVSGTTHVSFILWARKASFSTQLEYNLNLKDSMKVESQCNFYRLTSPNYQGSFEFNVAKNGGSVAFFQAECTYKPYTPYIKVVPQFGFLYGANYGDQRGLVCGGDFSLPRFNSAWETYLLNNKNYQNIFNRDIQNLTLEQTLERRQQIITGSAGILTAGVVGGGVGAQAGGIYGAIAGAVVGTAGSSVGFAADMDMLAIRQKEAKSLAIDKYNYQLGNIKALPYTLTKVGAFDINSKIWPFLEYYTCTDEEKDALNNKITYESMTVMRIEEVGHYFGAYADRHYLKGELIRNEDIAESNQILDALYYEFVKGVYC